ncbi:hypothetical protein DACRYDRAFT_21643 [Dacryopinax primogenitus]|uniref:Uncharacterized protein n=1 Tax=Dacryopinax primogenitus (strain DJM 731) TaxID=1858805 RepID=M5G9N8_DACPD|nr:uncharacterized protein DACRYDRAFT_21643 [Dacryopinax primogenitus]EJU02582.1 hypothetical protein DACRYDRAFT_21643 [Dacryopinax primogenitus]
MDVDDLEDRFNAFPDGGLEILLRCYDVPAIPQLVAYHPPSDQLLAGVAFESFDMLYGVQEGEAIDDWTVNSYTLFHGDSLRLPDLSINSHCCDVNIDRLYSDMTLALERDKLRNINPPTWRSALSRFYPTHL